jgi:membrane-bound inhibitor of C-type lysozyme
MMRRLTAPRLVGLLAIAAFTGVSACQQAEPEQPVAPVEPQPAPASAAPAVGYACESGAMVEARYPDTATAQLAYKGRTYDLRSVEAASGARYVGSGVEWWTAPRDGQERATLSRLGPNEEVGVAVLEQCARPVATAAAPVPPALPGQTTTPAPGGVLPASTPCKGPQLKLAAEGGDAGAGNRVRNFSLQNLGAQACSLTGYPGVTVQDAQGRAVTSIRADQSPGSYFRQGQAPTPVELAPRAKAYFEVAWNVVPDETMQKTCPSVATLRATAPGDTAAVSLPFEFQPCGGKIRVSPIRAEADPQTAT